jgi:hypothetical protein
MSCQGASLREGFATDEKWPFPGVDERVCVPADGTGQPKYLAQNSQRYASQQCFPSKWKMVSG